MIHAIIVSEDAHVGTFLQSVAAESDDIKVLRLVDRMPRTGYDIARLVHGLDPDLLLVVVPSAAAGLQDILRFPEHVPGLPIVAFGPDIAHRRRDCERAGIQVSRGFPPTLNAFREAIEEATMRAKRNETRRW